VETSVAVIVPFESHTTASIDQLVGLVAADMERVNATILARTGSDAVSVDIADLTGAPVASVGSLTVRPLATAQLPNAESLYRLEWVGAKTQNAVAPGVDTVFPVTTEGDVVASAHAVSTAVLEQAQSWLADEQTLGARLVFVTRGAVDGEDVAAASVWGLIRSAQAENPGRFVLVDSDGATEVMRWNLINAWVTQWRGTQLDALSQDVAIESLTLVCETLDRA